MKKFENSHTNASGVFPDTVAVDASGPSATDGTEYIAEGIGEKWGWMQALLDETGITPSGSTELAGAGLSDIVKGLKTLIGGKKIQPITAILAANAMTITLAPTYLDFRSATLGSGAVNHRNIETAINLVISSGSTLGTVNAIQSRIAVIAIDNAGTVELAAINLAGGNDLSETGLISTVAEGGAGAADAANVIYSTTLRSNVPYKVVGYIESTQATAGAWATNPSTIQGCGGQAFNAMSSIGYGQTWQEANDSGTFLDGTSDVRAANTPYQNTSGKPIRVSIYTINSADANSVVLTVDGVDVSTQAIGAGVASIINAAELIPPGATYTLTTARTLSKWNELR